jgi:hypothetical protein
MKRVEVEVKRENDDGATTFITYSHLGEILTYNDAVLGYDLDKL